MDNTEVVQTAQHVQTLIYFRGFERLLIELGAIGCVVLGTLLFRWGVRGTSTVGAEGAGHKLQLTNAAPGTILALFGMIVMLTALISPTKIDLKVSAEPSAPKAATASMNASVPSTGGMPLGTTPAIASAPSTHALSVSPPAAKAGSLSILYGNNPTAVKQLLTDLQAVQLKSLEPEQAAVLIADFRQRAGALKDEHMHKDVASLLRSIAGAPLADGTAALGLLGQYRDRARQLVAMEQ